jgi:glycosyltransferase involved in cell wall biosynthesis
MVPVSVVIITKNEAALISSCLDAAKLITDDIIVINNDSTDGTAEIAIKCGARVYHENWDGYGANKNKGIMRARYDWILSIDADEFPDREMVDALHELSLSDPAIVYDISFRSYFGQKRIRFGSWGRDHHIRLFNRKLVKWSQSPVHETLELPARAVVKKLHGHLHHYSVQDANDFMQKADHYAGLSAGKYLMAGKKPSFMKLHIAPAFHFIKNYIVFLGLLDGREGFLIAKMISRHTWLKYRLLKEQPGSPLQPQALKLKEGLAVEY